MNKPTDHKMFWKDNDERYIEVPLYLNQSQFDGLLLKSNNYIIILCEIIKVSFQGYKHNLIVSQLHWYTDSNIIREILVEL